MLQCVTPRYGNYVITLSYVALQVQCTLRDVIVIGKQFKLIKIVYNILLKTIVTSLCPDKQLMSTVPSLDVSH